MQLLDAVNLILPKLGEHGVTTVNTKHPTLAVLLPEIENELKKLLNKGWWFNEFDYTAYPDSEGFIAVGSNVLSFVPDKADIAVQRGDKLYNPLTLSYVFTEAVKGRVRQYIEFELIPESAAQTVLYGALVSVFSTDIGMSDEIQLWSSQAQAAYSDLLGEHLRQRKHTTRNSRKWGNFMRALRA